MIRRAAAWFVAAALAGSGVAARGQERRIALEDLRSGIAFSSRDIRAMQEDDFSNPAMLWVEKGAKLWSDGAQSCASCHGKAETSMKSVATRYPAIDRTSGRLLNLADRIMRCRSERQGAPALRHESDELLSLTAFVSHQSRGMPIGVSIEGPARPHFEAGREFFFRRIGQVDIACTHCHDANWGKTLLAETVSQGHPNAFPIYRTTWQTAGSIERRLRACLSGIRAEMLPYGAPEYRDLELYLAWRAQGLPIEAPGVRR